MLLQFNVLLRHNCHLIAILNSVAFTLHMRWLVDRRKKFMTVYCVINLFEMIFYVNKLDDPIPYVNYLSRYHFNLLCIGPCIAFLVDDFCKIEIAMRNVVYQESSFKDKPLGDNTCPICLDSYDDDPKYYLLECGHAAHAKCFDEWWKKISYKRCYFLCDQKK